MAASRTLTLYICIFSLLALAAISALVWLAVRRQVSRPLQSAAAIAESVAAGKLDGRIDTTRQDEIGQLAFIGVDLPVGLFADVADVRLGRIVLV